MKKITLLCLTALFACSVTAQTPHVDSLVNVLETQKLTDEEKLDIYTKICSDYRNMDIETLNLYFNKGLAIAEKRKDNMALTYLYGYTSGAYRDKRDYATALLYAKKFLTYAIATDDQTRMEYAYNRLGSIYTRLDSLVVANECYIHALGIAEKINDKEMYVMASYNLGCIQRSLGNADMAIRYFEKAENMAKEINDYDGLLYVYNELAFIYTLTKDLEKALFYAQNGLEISRNHNRRYAEGEANLSLGHIYSEKGDYDNALKYTNEGLKIANEINEWKTKANALHRLSDIYFKQKQYQKSINSAEEAWKMDTISSTFTASLALNIAYANIYLCNADEADDYLSKYIALKEALSEKQFQETLAETEVKYETEKKELRITALENEKTLYTWIIITSIVAALFAFGILFYRHKLNIQKRRQAEQQVKQLEQEKQLVAAQALIDGEAAERSRLARDLHDGLGGMLSVVKLNLKDMKGYSILDNLDIDHFNKAMVMLDQSINELRRVAHHIMPESLMRHGLKTSLDDFCRAVPGAAFRFFGDDTNLDSRLKTLIYRCAYELVNNAVKHASATNINVQLMIANGLISLSVHDNGTGFDPEKVMEGSGLENVRIRVASYNGKMNIYSSPGKGTEVSIEIELS
jgi:signal transduction histidine kinase